jgi:dihydroxyacetone kinase
MKRSGMVALGSALVFASMSLAGCSEANPDYDELCVNKETMVRVEDKECDGDGGGGRHGFVYVPYTGSAYPVGSKVTHPGASFTRPASGTFARGGFGGARGGSGGS